MNTNTTNSFNDEFSFVVALVVALLVLIDWLIGEERRASMKDKCGMWWIMVSDISFRGFLVKDAEFLVGLIRKVLGGRVPSARAFGIVFLTSLVITYVAMISSVILLARSDIWGEGVGGEIIGESIPDILIWSFPGAAVNSLLAYLSVLITFQLLRWMSKNVNLWILVLIIVCDIATALILTLAVLAINLLPFLLFVPDYAIVLLGLLYIGPLIAFCLTTLLPTAAHVLAGLAFIVSKLFRPLIQKPTEVLLLRFYQSRKGVLSVFAVFVGVVAKLVQYYWAI